MFLFDVFIDMFVYIFFIGLMRGNSQLKRHPFDLELLVLIDVLSDIYVERSLSNILCQRTWLSCDFLTLWS